MEDMEDYKDNTSVDQEIDFTINDVAPEENAESVFKENGGLNEPLEVHQDSEDIFESKTETSSDDSSKEDAPVNPNVEECPSNYVALLNSLQENLARLEEKFVKKIADDTHKNSLFDKMYEELASYKKDLYAKLVGPFVNETISLLDDYERLIDRIDTIDYEKLKKYVMGIPDDLESILDNNGVERYTDDTEKFNPKTQRVVKTIPTGNMELENVIAERTRKGYRWNGVMLKPEMVKIYKYKEGYVDPVTDVKQDEQNSPDNYSSEEKTKTAIENNQN